MDKINFNLDRFAIDSKEKNLFGEPVFEKKDRRKGITNERQIIIQDIIKELEKEHKVIIGRLLKKLKGYSNFRLYELISKAKDYRNRDKSKSFAKGFWGIIKNNEKIINDKNNTAKNANTNE